MLIQLSIASECLKQRNSLVQPSLGKVFTEDLRDQFGSGILQQGLNLPSHEIRVLTQIVMATIAAGGKRSISHFKVPVPPKGRCAATQNNFTTAGPFNRLQFNLLGNDLEALFLPSAIVILTEPSLHSVRIGSTFLAGRAGAGLGSAGAFVPAAKLLCE